jgi:hypothetical protein
VFFENALFAAPHKCHKKASSQNYHGVFFSIEGVKCGIISLFLRQKLMFITVGGEFFPENAEFVTKYHFLTESRELFFR